MQNFFVKINFLDFRPKKPLFNIYPIKPISLDLNKPILKKIHKDNGGGGGGGGCSKATKAVPHRILRGSLMNPMSFKYMRWPKTQLAPIYEEQE